MVQTYQIHPAIGIARLGDSPTEFYLSPEKPAALPLACDENGNPLLTPDGMSERTVDKFKDSQGRVKRQGARFQIFVHDSTSPNGRVLKIGDTVSGGGNTGTLVGIEWRVHLANKKAVWYEFDQLQGEHGYAPDHPLRNADITDSGERQMLIIDPGPQVVDTDQRRKASFAKGANPGYAQTFPPPLTPNNIETLGEIMTNDAGHLVVLGGHGNSGSFKTGMGEPRIQSYANNDGWFDDTSDGPVMARLKIYVENITTHRYLDVAAPAWCVVGYPRYVPQIQDMITAADVIFDMSIREFALLPQLYGKRGSFDNPQQVDAQDPEALAMWKAQELGWNPDFHVPFEAFVWPILSRPWYITWLTDVLSQSNFPHDQTERGSFFKKMLATPPTVDQAALKQHLQRECTQAAFQDWVNQNRARQGKPPINIDQWPEEKRQQEWAKFYGAKVKIFTRLCTEDPFRDARTYLYNTLRQPGEENIFKEKGRPNSRTQNAPLMPLLAGDNPITNVLPSKFLRLTDTQLYILRQWAEGKFVSLPESVPATGIISSVNPRNGVDGSMLDYGVLCNLAGGAFCPGAEVGWLIRNPSAYAGPFRLKADPNFAEFDQTAASAYKTPGVSFAYRNGDLSQGTNLDVGLQPGDFTKQMGCPWQADFNECSTQNIDVTYEEWNRTYPDSESDSRMKRARQTWETLWWPAHRPMQTLVITGFDNGQPSGYEWRDWAYGIPQTYAGDLKMVTSWKDLGFVVENPFISKKELATDNTTDLNRYIAVEQNLEK